MRTCYFNSEKQENELSLEGTSTMHAWMYADVRTLVYRITNEYRDFDESTSKEDSIANQGCNTLAESVRSIWKPEG